MSWDSKAGRPRIWRSSVDRCTERLRIVDLSEVTSIDRNGEETLLRMIHQGARCVATGIHTRHLLEQLQARTKKETQREETKTFRLLVKAGK